MTNPKACLRDPIPEIFLAATLLDAALAAHQLGKHGLAEGLLVESNLPAVRDWTESLWGSNSAYVNVLLRVSDQHEDEAAAGKQRMPLTAIKKALHERDGYHCRFCGIPVIRSEVRKRFEHLYPAARIWGSKNFDQHAAFQAMWAQYDHIVPHSRGGDNSLHNLVITCAPCNFGRMDYLLQEVGLADPREREPVKSEWTGLEGILSLERPQKAPQGGQ
jgi:hypothetical protein